jgi:hypothetical protein
VDDVDQLRAEFQGRGILTDITDVRDTPCRTREFHVRDPDETACSFTVISDPGMKGKRGKLKGAITDRRSLTTPFPVRVRRERVNPCTGDRALRIESSSLPRQSDERSATQNPDPATG